MASTGDEGMLDGGAMVWVPHDEHVWKRAVVVRRLPDGVSAEVRLQPNEDGSFDRDDGLEKVVNIQEIARMAGEVSDEAMPICNVFTPEGVDDMCTLNHLHEPAVLKNLELRFAKQMPYTYTGQICIAVNPYQWLDLYGTDLYRKYLDQPRDSLAPHPFALSATAYTDMKRSSVDQSILVSGESGAGKTETVKIMMNHLASISGGGDRGTLVIDQVLQSNPLLESFGNAKTKRNDNSSRFGKFAQLQFDALGSLVGARCETYLLEKSRVVGQARGERNYHIFYQIFRLTSERKAELRLSGDATNYKYVVAGADAELTGMDDAECLRETQAALDIIGISGDEQRAIFEIVAAILNLGELEFEPRGDKAEIANADIVDNVGHLLQTELSALRSTLLERSITAGSESYTIPLNAEQATDLRDALAKGMYTQLFDWLVARINRAICSTRNVATHIGLLDIFGFESFETNGFEQLCINYANEKLQQKFNSDVFKVVQQEYVEEGIPLDLVTFEDNQPILDLIEGRMGIVSLLNEEVLRPQATDTTFVSRVLDAFSDHPNIEKSRLNQMQFLIRHYAGDVMYNGTGFLDKNKDTLPPDMVQLLSGSSSSFISGVFSPSSNVSAGNGKANGKGKKAGRQQGFLVGNTIAGGFRKQLGELMETINKTESQYVRCIKPNANKSPVEFDRLMIVEQLRCAGVIAAIRISRAAFPNRLPLVEFQQRFQIICPSALRNAEPTAMVAGLLQELIPEMATTMQNTKFAVGKSKVYFSSGLLQKLEDRRNVILKDHAVMIQKTMRGHIHRKRFVAQRGAAIKVQAITRRGLQFQKYQKLRAGVIKVQSLARGRKQRHAFAVLVEEVRRQKALERERELQAARERELALQREKEAAAAAAALAVDSDEEDPQPEPVEDDWSDEDDKEARGPVSPRTLRALTEAASKVAEAEAAARDAKSAAEAALELNRELVSQNDRLRSTLSSNVAEYADAELLRENDRLKQQVLQLQTKLVRSQEVSLISAKVVDSRITYREGRQFVEYKLQIETNTRGTLYVWHRYSTFRNLAATLQTKNGYKRKEIPELPNKQLFGNFSEKIIQDRVAKLNQFLEAATNAEYLQWGIRVDQDTCVYKRRVKSANGPRDSTMSMASTVNSSPRASSRLSMKSFSFRRGSTAGN